VFLGDRRSFCLHEEYTEENLETTLRGRALEQFNKNNIYWYKQVGDKPTGHLCSSQVFCVNALAGYHDKPELLKKALHGLGYDVKEVLPIFEKSGERPYVAFEWIGEQNYLGERKGGGVAKNRMRGEYFTSADFIVRFVRTDGKIQIVLGEWKYTESYKGEYLQFSSSGADRVAIYRNAINAPNSHITLPSIVSVEVLFYEPFYQMMRLHLLASAMQGAREMDADVVTVLYVSPIANSDFEYCVRFTPLAKITNSVFKAWHALIKPGMFHSVYTEQFLSILMNCAPNMTWASYMDIRYAPMK